jgi:hypothetical protein
MHEPAGPALLAWLETTPVAVAMRHWLWLYPGVEVAHLAGIVLLVGAVALFDLRLLGAGRALDAGALARYLLPWSWVGLALLVPSGMLMFSAHATEMAANPAFRVKLALIAAAGANAWWFHRGAGRRARAWACGAATPAAARLAAALSLALWIGVIACGRLLAYL